MRPRGRTIAIGDIHGCAAALLALLDAIGPRPEDVIVTLGDYANRGPDSRGVIDRLIALEKQCTLVPILGNHDEMLLGLLDRVRAGHSPSLQGWLKMGGDATLASYGSNPGSMAAADLTRIPPEHQDFLGRCRGWHETATHIFTHAQYDPDAAMDKQRAEVLRWESLRDGIPEPHESGKTVIVGHTSQKHGEILDMGHLVCIDTYCHGGGWLTGLDVDTGELWQFDREGNPR